MPAFHGDIVCSVFCRKCDSQAIPRRQEVAAGLLQCMERGTNPECSLLPPLRRQAHPRHTIERMCTFMFLLAALTSYSCFASYHSDRSLE